MNPICTLRASETRDLPAICAIYGHHVLHGLASFEVEAPDVEEMARRREHVLALGLPYLVAESGGRVVGYAYAALYRTRPAYRYTLEDSIYIDRDHAGKGIGRILLQALIAGCEGAGYRQMIAVIGDSANFASIQLHAVCGFKHVGLLPATGFKFGRWVDSVLMQRPLGEGAGSPPKHAPEADPR